MKPEKLMPLELWSKCLKLVNLSEQIACRTVCLGFKKEVEEILGKQKKLWLRCRDDKVFDCFHPDHLVSEEETIEYAYETCPSIKELEGIAPLFPSLVVLKLETREKFWDQTPPVLKLFPSTVCLVAPGYLSDGDLSFESEDNKPANLKHLLADEVSLEPENIKKLYLESLEVLRLNNPQDVGPDDIPFPSKRFSAMNFNYFGVNRIPKTMEVCEALISFQNYTRTGEVTHPNLRKIGRPWPYWCSLLTDNIQGFIDFLDDNKHIKELSFTAATGNIWSLSDLMPSLKFLEWLEVYVDDESTVKVFKDQLRLHAVNLRYLSFVVYFGRTSGEGPQPDDTRLQRVIDSLPDNTNNLTVYFEGWRQTQYGFDELVIQSLQAGNPRQITLKRVNEMEDEWKNQWQDNHLIETEGISSQWEFLPVNESYLNSEIIVLRRATV